MFFFIKFTHLTHFYAHTHTHFVIKNEGFMYVFLTESTHLTHLYAYTHTDI